MSRDSGDKTPSITAFLSPCLKRKTHERTDSYAVTGAQCRAVRKGCPEKAVFELGPAA